MNFKNSFSAIGVSTRFVIFYTKGNLPTKEMSLMSTSSEFVGEVEAVIAKEQREDH